MAQRQARRLAALTGSRAAEQLQIVLVDHPDAGSADRMAEALEAAVDLAGQGAVSIEEAVEHVFPAFAGFGDVQVLHGDHLSHREAIVHFEQTDLLARVGDARFLIGARGRDTGGIKVAAGPSRSLRLPAVRNRQLQRLHGDDVLLAQGTGNLSEKAKLFDNRVSPKGNQYGTHIDGVGEGRTV
jgi:hypothetical protein